MTTLKNGAVWYDTQGNTLHAHGGHMLKKDGYYYWYGENRTENIYVSCYRSTDLINWEFRCNSLTTQSPTEAVRIRTHLPLTGTGGGKVNLERPKVLYNALTGKYVLWVHYENGSDYTCAACAIATSDTPDGEFTYHGSFNPLGYMSRDCTLFQEEDGTAYFISASRDNADLNVYRLAEDYMNVDSLIHKLWPGEYREAPAVMVRDGKCYLFSSFCTGWAPNQCKYAVSEGMERRWSLLANIGDETTFHTQPAFILPVSGTEETTYLYVSDRWNGKNYHDSRYVFLPISFDANGVPTLNYCDTFGIDLKTGRFLTHD